LRKQKINLPKANEEYAAKNFEMLRGWVTEFQILIDL
jgi:hypothetical protein